MKTLLWTIVALIALSVCVIGRYMLHGAHRPERPPVVLNETVTLQTIGTNRVQISKIRIAIPDQAQLEEVALRLTNSVALSNIWFKGMLLKVVSNYDGSRRSVPILRPKP